MQKNNVKNFRIAERQDQGIMVTAKQREVYYPVFPIPPVDTKEPSLGFDLGSNISRRQALETAIDTGEMIVSKRIKLVHEREDDQYGFIVFAAVYSSHQPSNSIEARRQAVKGIIIGVFRIKSIVDSTLTNSGKTSMRLTIADESAPLSERILFRSSGSETVNKQLLVMTYRKSITLGNRTWSISAIPIESYLDLKWRDISWWILVSGTTLAGLVFYYLVVSRRKNRTIRDINRALKNSQDQLENRVEQKTRELESAQTQLIRRERLATLGQLIATVAHELPNPLGAMRPSLYIIDKKIDHKDEHLQRAMERIDTNIDRCDRIISELLDFTRVTELARNTTQIDPWLASVIDEQNIPEDIQVVQDFRLNDLKLTIDTERLRRAVINVIENACHVMQDNRHPPRVRKDSYLRVETRYENERISIAISDTAVGIPEDLLDEVFEPLFSSKSFGVGMGMPTVQQIMEQHGGSIEIDSEVEKGTTVLLWLPCV